MTPEQLVQSEQAFQELLKLRPPTTRAQAAARNKAGQLLEGKYPNQHVAYVDNWTGDELDRKVVAASTDWDEFQRLLKALDPEVRNRVEMTHVPDPEQGFFIGGGALWSS